MSEGELNKSGADDKPILEAESKGSIWAGLGLTLLFHFVVQVSLLFILGTIVTGERAWS